MKGKTSLKGLLLVLLTGWPALCFSQIDVPAVTPQGRFVRLSYTGDKPDPDHGQNAYQLMVDEACEAHDLGDGKFLIVAAPGKHSGLLSVATQTWDLVQAVVEEEDGGKTTAPVPTNLGLAITTYRFDFTVEGTTPPEPDEPDVPDPDEPDVPDPDEPDVPDPDVPAPDDPWKVGDVVEEVGKTIPLTARTQATDTAKLFEQAADGLIPEDGADIVFPSINDAIIWLKKERTELWGSRAGEWAPVVMAINEIWLDPSQRPSSKTEVAQFYRAVAYGLRKIQAF